MNKLNKCHVIEIANEQHTQSISRIYQLVKIEPERLHEIADLLARKPMSSQRIEPLDGFISPQEERAIQLTLQNGLALICVLNNKVIGYNRVVTQADKVHQEFCAEFQVDQSLREFRCDQFSNWSGHKELQPGKVLKCVHWYDKGQALIAFNAAMAGLENKRSGRLSWSIDSAVHPGNQKTGVSSALVHRLNNELRPKFKYRAFRMFEICKVNGIEVAIANAPSKKAFVNSSSKQFAWTEEEIYIDSSLTLRVRWNHWLRQF